jgi:hypothetical protein
MEEISKRIWKDYMGIRGGDFSNWYEGLSPIEVKIFPLCALYPPIKPSVDFNIN